MTYKVELIETEEGFAVGCPDLPGCWTQGDTEEKALSNIRDAIKDWVEVDREMKARRQIRSVEVLAS